MRLDIGFFSESTFLKNIFRKEAIDLQSVHCRLATLLNELHQRRFPENFPNLCNQLFWVITSTVLRNWITWKATWNWDVNAWEGQPLLLYTDYPKHETFAWKEPQKRSTKLSVLNLEGAFSVKYLLTHF